MTDKSNSHRPMGASSDLQGLMAYGAPRRKHIPWWQNEAIQPVPAHFRKGFPSAPVDRLRNPGYPGNR